MRMSILTRLSPQLAQIATAVTDEDCSDATRAAAAEQFSRWGEATPEFLVAIATKVDCVTTLWGCRIFIAWLRERAGFEGDFSLASSAQLDDWLARFALEVNRPDGSPYRRDTYKGVMAALNRHLENTRKNMHVLHNIPSSPRSIFEDIEFQKFQRCYDERCKL